MSAQFLIEETGLGQIAEVATLFTCFCLGWIVWAAFLQKVERSALGLGKSLENTVEGYEDTTSDMSSDCVPEDGMSATRALNLFEDYGLFGALPGAWVTDLGAEEEPACSNADSAAESHESDFEFEAARQDFDTSKSATLKLFESYSLFGAAAGSWSGWVEQYDAVVSDSRPSERDHNFTPQSPTDLFESYGLFGAASGAWSSRSSAEAQEEPLNTGEDSVSPTAGSLAKMLEQYGLFEAEHGTWCKTCPKARWSIDSTASTAVSEDDIATPVGWIDASDSEDSEDKGCMGDIDDEDDGDATKVADADASIHKDRSGWR